MHVLVIAHRPPLAPIDGGSMATHAIITGLLDAGHRVQVLAVETGRHPADASRDQRELAAATRFDTWRIDTRVTPVRAVRGLFQESFNVQRFDHPDGRDLIRRRLAADPVDVVILDSLYTTPYLPVVRQATTAPVVLRPQNVEHHIWQLRATDTTGLRARYFNHLARQLESYERRVFNSVDGVAAISADDQRAIAAVAPSTPVAVVEVGMAPEGEAAPVDAGAPLCSVASYDWAPNVEGMRWFLDEVWPLVRNLDPSAELHLAGRRLERYAAELRRPGVEILGAVPSASGFLTPRGVVIAPLRSGSGVRVKLVEAMLLGKPIVTTTVGCLGLGVEALSDPPLLVHDDPAGFAHAVVALRSDGERANRLGAAALRAASERYSLRSTTAALMTLLDQVRATTGEDT